MRIRPIRSIAALCAASLIALAGCGGGGDGDGERTVTRALTVTETTSQPTETGSAAQGSGGGVASFGPRFFQTPSGNIGCYLDARAARCDIRQRDWSPPPAPASCQLDYGQGLIVTASGARLVCAGDTALGGRATLDYGEQAQRGRIRCDSEESGITCTDTGSGRGFTIARQSYEIF